MSAASIHPTALVDPAAELGEGVEIGPYCVVSGDVRIGAGARLLGHVHVHAWTEIGPEVQVHPFAVLGGPPQDTSYRGEPTRLVIGARTVIREHATLHRGTARGKGVTRVGDDCFLMGQSHVAHDCVVEDRVTLAQGATLGGHAHIGAGAILGGLCAIHQRGRVGRGAMIGGLAAVVDDVIPYGLAAGNHARLMGLNYVGLKRRGLSKEALRRLRQGYIALFESGGPFRERLAAAQAELAGQAPELDEILAFLAADGARPIMLAQ